MFIGQKVFVRDTFISDDYMVPKATIVDVAYYEDCNLPKVYLVEFDNGLVKWMEPLTLKKE